MDIPAKVQSYKENTRGTRTYKRNKFLTYGSKNGGEMAVVYWVRWPSYDFIFGIPAKGNKYYGQEVAFFQFRDTRHKKVHEGFYLDRGELKEMIRGWQLIQKNLAILDK